MSRHAALFAAVFGLLFALLWLAVGFGLTDAADLAAVRLFRDPANMATLVGPDWLHEVGRDLTAVGSTVVLGALTAAVLGYLLLRERLGLALFTLVAVGGGAAVSFCLKALIDRPRPDVEAVAQVFTTSFPSGHAALSAVTFLTLGALITRTEPSRKLRFYYVGLATAATVVVGLSRLYLGLHYPSDIVAGWLVGGAWGALCLAILGAMPQSKKEAHQ
jgi:undecaprenyl-diphosphatase